MTCSRMINYQPSREYQVMITAEEIQQLRSPSVLRKFVDHVFASVRSDTSEWKLGMQKKGWYKEFIDEIAPLSRFAVLEYPDTYLIEPVLGNQGFDARVFNETGTEVDKVEMTRPHNGNWRAADARLVVSRGFSKIRVQDPGDDFDALVPVIVDTCKSKARKDYEDCTLVIAISPQPPLAHFDARFEQQVQNLTDNLRKIAFKAKRVFLLILPDRVEAINDNPPTKRAAEGNRRLTLIKTSV